MRAKRVVIVAKFIFPRISPRAMRASELAKEFARQGYDVTLYAALDSYDYSAYELEYGIKVVDLGPLRFSSTNDEVRPLFTQRILRKVLNPILEYPDIELAFLVNKALKKEENIDILITVAIPFPIHWGAAYRKTKALSSFARTWIADCGDPYMGNKFHKRAFYFKYVEKWFCGLADYITIPIEGGRVGYYPEFNEKIKVIPQGFDFRDVHKLEKYFGNDVLTFIYAGAFYSGVRDPRPLLDYLSTRTDLNFRFEIYTKSRGMLEPYIDLLGDKLLVKDYMPREELLNKMSKADFLVNFENNTSIQAPSKLIDYALAKRPVLSINSSEGLPVNTVASFLIGDYSKSLVVADIEKYNIENVCKEFIKLSKTETV